MTPKTPEPRYSRRSAIKGYNQVLDAARKWGGDGYGADIAAETGDVCIQTQEPRTDRWLDGDELIQFAATL